ncbi:MAG: helix-turn-helix domain-containing protein [Microbispora sp.]|nr:helix-turn-helix domain-containing protein [Microbispora sp.]
MSEHSGEHASSIDPRAHRVLADVSRVAVLETLRRAGRPLSIPDIAAEVGLHPNTVRAHLALLVEHGYAVGRTEERERPGRPRLLYTAAALPGVEEPGDGERRNYRLLAEVLITYLSGADGPGGGAAALAAGRAYGHRIVHGDAPHALSGPGSIDLSGHRAGRDEPSTTPAENSDGSGPGPSHTIGSGRGKAADAGCAGLSMVGAEHGDGPGPVADAGQGGASGAVPQAGADVAVERVVALLDEAGFAPRLAPDGSHIDLHRCPFHELAEANPEVVCGVHLGLMQGALADLGAPITATSLRPFVRPGVCVATLGPGGEEER